MVISLGALLLGGVIILVAVLAARTQKGDHTATCIPATYQVPEGAEVMRSYHHPDKVLLTLQLEDETTQFLTLDSCTGEIEAALTVQ